jgi:antimicrobial peptide system SdpB family protein
VDPFCLAGPHLEWARWLCIALLVVVASGWRPRLTGVIHWWITFGVQASGATLDGGDQIAAILTLILIPVTLTDDRLWHWETRLTTSASEPYKRVIAKTALTVVRVQMALVYLHAAVGKAYSARWQDGTALYYWFTNPDFGAPLWLERLLRPLLLNGASVTAMSWAIIALELALAAGLVVPRSRWRGLLVLGVSLHLGILVVHGLVSFVLAMIGGLVLYLRPVERPFRGTVRPRGWSSSTELAPAEVTA